MTLQWLLPIGFVSLLGIGILILIYIIKPSYQKKVISSTYAWQRAIKKKKELPIDKFRNIILFLCQALILAACGMIFARPNLMKQDIIDTTVERIMIVDASADMRAHYAGDQQGVTRFDRAINEVRVALDEVVIAQNGLISVIIADEEPYFLIDRAGRGDYSEAVTALEGLSCCNGTGDIEAAMRLAQARVYNASTEVVILSGTEFGDMGGVVTSVNLADLSREWNIAVLGCDVVSEDSEFVFNISLGAYGRVSTKKTLTVDINGADLDTGELLDLPLLKIPVTFDVNSDSSGYEQRQTIVVKATDETIGGRADFLYSSFQDAVITIEDLNDSIADDDVMTVYGGVKDTIKIEYYSSEANVFYYLGFNFLRDGLRSMRDITFVPTEGREPQLSGFDIYIFEHSIPNDVIAYGLPTDGVIFLVDPDREVAGIDVAYGEKVSFKSLTSLGAGMAHPLTNYIDPARNGVTQYTRIMEYDADFTPLLYCNGDPVLLAKNTPSSKIIVMPFSLNLSDFIKWDFETLLYNIIMYYFPLTVTKYNFEYGETTEINCKGESLIVANEKTSYVLRSFPVELKLEELGRYTFTVRSGMDRPDEVRKVMVRIPHSESGIFAISDARIMLDSSETYARSVNDLFPYLALAIVIMLFVEWWLQFRHEA